MARQPLWRLHRKGQGEEVIPNKLKVKLVHPKAVPPRKMTEGSAGFDLFAAEAMVIPPSQCNESGHVEVGRGLVRTGLVLELPRHSVGRIGSRSGLSTRHNIEVGAGWIDGDYRGEVLVELKNLGSKPFEVKPGDRIAQLVVLPLLQVEAEVVEEVEESRRGSGGFGSTEGKYLERN